MELTIQTFIIVCPLLFLAGMVDAIGGGGGLISLPAYLLAGLPPHAAVATNKMSSPFGTALATYRFAKNQLINVKLAVPSIFAAIAGSFIGSHISLLVPESVMTYVLVIILPFSAFLVLNKSLFNDSGSQEVTPEKKTRRPKLRSVWSYYNYIFYYSSGTMIRSFVKLFSTSHPSSVMITRSSIRTPIPSSWM